MASDDTLVVLLAQSSHPPSSGAASPDRRNDLPVLDFPDTPAGKAYFLAKMPQHYAGGGVTVTLELKATSATSGNCEFTMKWQKQDGDIDSDTFASGQDSGDVAVNGTSGISFTATITFTDGAQMDNVGAGDWFRLELTRTAASASEATGDIEFVGMEIRESS
jgi:hypothetical protein